MGRGSESRYLTIIITLARWASSAHHHPTISRAGIQEALVPGDTCSLSTYGYMAF
jgi:hypothetical protein